jgi:hypothetical protein
MSALVVASRIVAGKNGEPGFAGSVLSTIVSLNSQVPVFGGDSPVVGAD